MIHMQHKTQDRVAEWMWSGLCDEAQCVRDAVERNSSCTVIHKHSYSTADDFTGRTVCMLLCPNEQLEGVQYKLQAWLLDPNTHSWPSPFLLMLLYDTDIDTPNPLHSISSNSVHTHALYTTPENNNQSVWMIRIWLLWVNVSNHSVLSDRQR